MSDQIGSARQEAERLIAAALAAAQLASRRFASPQQPAAGRPQPAAGPPAGGQPQSPTGPRMATGDPECCICPVCRAIAALREPDPHLAERLVTGAGDFAVGLTSLLRSFGAAAGQPRGAGHPRGGRPSPDADSVWRAATRTGDDASAAAGPFASAPGRDAWAQATAGPVDDAGRPVSQAGSPPSAEATTPRDTTSRKPMAKKATRPAAGRGVATDVSASGTDVDAAASRPDVDAAASGTHVDVAASGTHDDAAASGTVAGSAGSGQSGTTAPKKARKATGARAAKTPGAKAAKSTGAKGAKQTAAEGAAGRGRAPAPDAAGRPIRTRPRGRRVAGGDDA